jgi:hypothetical protein
MLASDDGVGKGTTKYSQGQKSAAKSQAESSKKIAGHNLPQKSHLAFHRQNGGGASVLGYDTGRSMKCHGKNHRRPILELCGNQFTRHAALASIIGLRDHSMAT